MKQQNPPHIIRIAIGAEFERLRALWPRAERRARRTKTILDAEVDSYLQKNIIISGIHVSLRGGIGSLTTESLTPRSLKLEYGGERSILLQHHDNRFYFEL